MVKFGSAAYICSCYQNLTWGKSNFGGGKFGSGGKIWNNWKFLDA